MPQNSQSNDPKSFKRFARFNLAFSASFIVHAVLFCLLGGAIIQYGKKDTYSIRAMSEFVPDLMVPDQLETEELENPMTDEPSLASPDQEVGGSSGNEATSPDIIVTETPTLSAPTMFSSNSPSVTLGTASGTGTGSGTGSGNGTGNGRGSTPRLSGLFGTKEISNEGLTGYMYDLKQSPDRKPLQTDAWQFITAFLDKWDEKALEKFYRAPEPLTAFQWFIPSMGAGGAPQAFNVEKEVQPNNWLIFYQGKITSKVTGTFRFVGIGDDVLFVRFNKKFVLDGSWHPAIKGMNSDKEEYNGPYLGNSDMLMRVGQWFKVKEGETYPMEVLIGEVPGTAFAIYLTIEEKGKTYEKRPDGKGIQLPIFQTAPTSPPEFEQGARGPIVTKDPFNFVTPAATAP